MSIYYNCEKLPRTSDKEKSNSLYGKELLETLQRKLLKESQTKSTRQDGSPPAGEKLFIFSVKNVNDSLKRKKVMESIETLESASISICYEDKDITGEFANLAGLGSLAKLYR